MKRLHEARTRRIQQKTDPIAICAPIPGIAAHDNFKGGRSYSAVVAAGVKVPQSAPMHVQGTSSYQGSRGQKEGPARPTTTRESEIVAEKQHFSIDDVVKDVLRSVDEKLNDLVNKAVAKALDELLPALIQKVVDSLKTYLPGLISAIIAQGGQPLAIQGIPVERQLINRGSSTSNINEST